MIKQKPIVFTGITPSGILTIGHYLSIIKNLKDLKNEYDIIIMIADLHATTLLNEKEVNYKKNSLDIIRLLIACGLEESKIFIQSEIPEHLFLSHIISSYISVSTLENMIQYKEKKKSESSGNLSLLSYPVLMTADILMYDANLIIVGEDQKQHLELASLISKRMSFIFELFPKFIIPKEGGKIMGLKNPQKKMSKSANDYISLLDSPKEVKRKIRKAQTDSDNEVFYDIKNKPGVSNLLMIYSLLKNKTLKECESFFKNSNYNDFKNEIIDAINEILKSIKIKYDKCSKKEVKSKIVKARKILRLKAKEKITNLKKEIDLWF